MRQFLLIAHRWAGLTITLVLVTTGLTGAILPYHSELNRMMAPELWRAAPPTSGAVPLSGLELKQRVEAETGGRVSYIKLEADPDTAAAIFVSRRPEGPVLDYNEVLVDPYTGAIRKRIRYGDLRDGRVNWVPALVNFHYTLGLGSWGGFFLGVAALIWCFECLIGIWISLPRMNGRGWRDRLRRWWPAWRVRTKQGERVFTYDAHRATGLWLWPVMLVFAWSAVAFNLKAVHDPVQQFFGGQGLYRPVLNLAPDKGEAMSPERAQAVGARWMAWQARQDGFTIRGPEALSFNASANLIGYYARTSLDGPTDRGSTAMWFDQASGRLIEFRPPYGKTSADAVDKAVRMLHTADLFGWPYKVFVTLVGLLTAGMAIAGFSLWLRRQIRRGRNMSSGSVR